jgi:hypothetical protein
MAAAVALGAEVGTAVAEGALVAGSSLVAAGPVVAAGAGALVAAGAEVAAGAAVGRGVAVADAPQATMKSRIRITEVNIIALELFSQRLRIIRPLRYKISGEPPLVAGRGNHWSLLLISSHERRFT